MLIGRILSDRSARALGGAAAALCAALLLAAAGPTESRAAGPIVVGAGEHGAFSRVALPLRPRPGWRATATENGIEIRLPGDDLSFDMRQVITRRKAHRVITMEAAREGAETVIRIGFNCACRARVYPYRDMMLLVDVRDGAAPTETAASEAPPAPRPAPAQAFQPAATPSAPAPASSPIGADATAHAETRADQAAAREAARTAAPDAAPASEAAPSADPSADAVVDARRSLLRQLERAAAEGLIAFQDDAREELAAEFGVEAEIPPVDDAETPDAPEIEAAAPATDVAPMEDVADPAAGAEGTAPASPSAAARAEDASTADASTADPLAADPLAARGVDRLLASAGAGGVEAAIERSEAAARAPSQPLRSPAAPSPAEIEAPTRGAERPAAPAPTPRAAAEGDSRQGFDLTPTRAAPRDPRGSDIETADARPARNLDACLADEALDIALWTDERSFSRGLAARRSALYDERNRVDVDAVAQLARFYIAEGLGEEAGHIVRSFDLPPAIGDLLIHAADVVRGAPPAQGSPFAADVGPCPGRHGLWSAAGLADQDPAAAAAAYDAAGLVLALTPEPLRRDFGARIGEALAEIGDWDGLTEVMRLLERSRGEPTDAMRMLRAELGIESEKIAFARRELTEVMEARSPRAPYAAIRLAETLDAPAEHGEARRVAILLEDYALQHRRSPAGFDVVEAQARLHGRFDQLSEAVATLRRAQSRDALPIDRLLRVKRDIVRSEIVDVIADPTPDRAIEAIDAIAYLDDDPDGDEVRVMLARMLIDTDTPNLVPLVIDDAVAARSPGAAAIAVEAAATLDLRGEDAPGRRFEPLDRDADRRRDAVAAAAASGFSDARVRALSHYVSGDDALPATLEQALEADDPEAADAVRSMFATPEELTPDIGPLDRGQELLRVLDAELRLLKEISSDG